MNKQIINWKRNFFTIWAGQAVSLITSAILQMALIWHLTDKTGSAMVLSIATLAGFLPQAVFGPFIGVLVDRYHRKYVMIGADLLIAAAGSALALISLFMELPVWAVMAVLFVRSLGTAFHSPALGAATPLLVPEDQLTRCAGYTQSIQSASYIIAPAAAALLYSIWGLNVIIAVDVAGALVACIATVLAVIPMQEAKSAGTPIRFMREMKEGYAVLQGDRGLFALLWIGAAYVLIYMPVNALFPLMSMGYFGGTMTHASIVEILFASGMLIGGLLLGIWGGFQNRALTIIASILLMGISLTAAGLLPPGGFWAFAGFCTLMGFSGPFYSGVQMALFQEKVNSEYLGRVFSLLGSVMAVAMPVGLVLSGIFADQIGVNRWFMISGILMIGIAGVTALLRDIRILGEKRS